MTFQFDPRSLNSAEQVSPKLPLLTVTFCKDLAGEEKLRKAGFGRIWRLGNGLENLDEAVYDFRGRPGRLVIVDDLRICGLTQKDICAKVSAITKLGITIVDLEHPEEDSHLLIARALRALHASRPIRNHRTARRRGRMGGLARAEAARIARDTRCAEDIAVRLCNHPKLAWADKLFILGDGFTRSSVERHYKI